MDLANLCIVGAGEALADDRREGSRLEACRARGEASRLREAAMNVKVSINGSSKLVDVSKRTSSAS